MRIGLYFIWYDISYILCGSNRTGNLFSSRDTTLLPLDETYGTDIVDGGDVVIDGPNRRRGLLEEVVSDGSGLYMTYAFQNILLNCKDDDGDYKLDFSMAVGQIMTQIPVIIGGDPSVMSLTEKKQDGNGSRKLLVEDGINFEVPVRVPTLECWQMDNVSLDIQVKGPTEVPSSQPSTLPSATPSLQPSTLPSATPSLQPSTLPSTGPSPQPSNQHSAVPSMKPSKAPSNPPVVIDTDGDGLSDTYELNNNPYVTNPDLADSDGDGLSDAE